MMIHADHAVIFSMILFGIGLVGLLTRRNLVIIFVSVELMLNAVNLNLISMSRRVPAPFAPANGDALALFVILLAAVEVAVGLGLLLRLYDIHQKAVVEDIEELTD